MTEQVIQVGDFVRIVDPNIFVSSFAKKVADRDAIVLTVGPTALGMYKGRVFVEFQKRNGRGKTFKEWLRISDVCKRGQQ